MIATFHGSSQSANFFSCWFSICDFYKWSNGCVPKISGINQNVGFKVLKSDIAYPTAKILSALNTTCFKFRTTLRFQSLLQVVDVVSPHCNWMHSMCPLCLFAWRVNMRPWLAKLQRNDWINEERKHGIDDESTGVLSARNWICCIENQLPEVTVNLAVCVCYYLWGSSASLLSPLEGPWESRPARMEVTSGGWAYFQSPMLTIYTLTERRTRRHYSTSDRHFHRTASAARPADQI